MLLLSVGPLLAGCAQGDDASGQGGDDPSGAAENGGRGDASSAPATADVVRFLEDLSSADLARITASVEATEEGAVAGAVAHAFADFADFAAQSQVDGREALGAAGTVSAADGGTYEVCRSGDGDREQCTTYGAFEASGGKITSFTLEGDDLTNRVSMGNGRVQQSDGVGTVELLGTYQSTAGHVLIALEVRSRGTAITVDAANAHHRDPGGQESRPNYLAGRTDLKADSRSNVTVQFENVDPGGVPTLDVTAPDGPRSSVVRIDTR